jgi:AAA domain
MNSELNAKTAAVANVLQATTLKTLLAKQFPKREYLIAPVMKEGESMMLWAAPGVGKTMLALSLAVAVAGGGEVLGLTGVGKRRVLIIDGEMNEADLQDRFKALLPAVVGCDVDDAAENVTIIARQAQRLDTTFPDLADSEGQQRVLGMALKGKFDLVILDNFSTLATLEDENSSSAMDPVLRFLMQMKQAGVACILIHHSAKDGMKYRGSSKIETTFEAILGLRRPDGLDENHRASFEMEWTKFRNIRNNATKGKKAWLIEDVPSKTLQWKHESSESEEVTRLLGLLKSGQYATQKDLARAMDVSEPTITRLKARAKAERRIVDEEWKSYLEVGREAGVLQHLDNSAVAF